MIESNISVSDDKKCRRLDALFAAKDRAGSGAFWVAVRAAIVGGMREAF
jgi:hypothetical protein